MRLIFILCREARWDLPDGEELLVLDQRSTTTSSATSTVATTTMLAATTQPVMTTMMTSSSFVEDAGDRLVRRADFKRHVSALVAKCIEPYRKRFFPTGTEYASFLRKVCLFFY